MEGYPPNSCTPGTMLEALIHSLECVAILSVLAAVGYFTAKLNWYDAAARSLIARLVTFVSLPAYLYTSVMEGVTREDLIGFAGPMVLPFVSIWSCFLVSRIVVRAAKIDRMHSGIFSSAFTATNNMFIGLPVSLALFGTDSVVPTLLYFFANTPFFWTMGNYLEAVDGAEATHGPVVPVFSLTTLKRVFSPPLIGFLGAIVMILLGLSLPEWLMTSAKYLAGVSTPMALIFIGIMIQAIGLRNIRINKDLAWVFAGRFLICPTVCLALCLVWPDLDPLFMKVYVIQAALPCITQIAVLAKFHHADVKFATTAVASTTVFSAATLPVWMILMTAVI